MSGEREVRGRLRGKAAVITGAGSGIGRATALLFAEEGASVMCADINADTAAATARIASEAGGVADFATIDVTSPTQVQGMIEDTLARFGALDILVNNAGIESVLPLVQVSEEEWDRLIDVNLKAVYLGCKYAIPRMIERGGGAIVNMASLAGLRGSSYQTIYCASKGGVVMLTRATAVEYARQGIRVNCVCPGVIDTPLIEGAAQALPLSREQFYRLMAEAHPLGRMGRPEEVAQAVLFLASDEAAFITGEALSVDGGANAAAPFPVDLEAAQRG